MIFLKQTLINNAVISCTTSGSCCAPRACSSFNKLSDSVHCVALSSLAHVAAKDWLDLIRSIRSAASFTSSSGRDFPGILHGMLNRSGEKNELNPFKPNKIQWNNMSLIQNTLLQHLLPQACPCLGWLHTY